MICGCNRKSTQQRFAGLVKLTSEKASYETVKFNISFHDAVFHNEEIAIDLKIENLSNSSIKIIPSNWNFVTHFRKDSYKDSELDYIINPVERLAELRKIRKLNKNRWWARPIGGLLKFSAATLTQGYLEVDQLKAESIQDVAASPFEAVKSIKEGKEAEFWEAVILKPVTIAPGKAINGLIFLEYDIDATDYDLYLSIDNVRVSHRIKQDN